MDEIAPAQFLKDQLKWLRRRAKPEERARIAWWMERIEILAKQEPAAEPVAAGAVSQTAAVGSV